MIGHVGDLTIRAVLEGVGGGGIAARVWIFIDAIIAGCDHAVKPVIGTLGPATVGEVASEQLMTAVIEIVSAAGEPLVAYLNFRPRTEIIVRLIFYRSNEYKPIDNSMDAIQIPVTTVIGFAPLQTKSL